MRPTLLPIVMLAILLLPPAGCGSKVSESNYYRVQYGMDEKEVEDLLGPAATEAVGNDPASAPASKPLTERKVKTWSRAGLTLSVVFVEGKVIARSADGLPFEGKSAPAPASKPSG